MNQVYQIVTDKILTELRNGKVPWNKPWQTSAPTNLVSKKAYRGVNNLLLSLTGYASPFWVTFKQAQSLGGCVKKGEKSSLVTFWKRCEKPEDDDDGKRSFLVLRYYNVFNVEQTTIPEEKIPKAERLAFEPIAKAESIVANMPQAPKIEHGGARACYSPMFDSVTMPHKNRFESVPAYYSVLFHELGHSTGHASRLNRDLVGNAFASHEYTQEELTAEMTACFICAESGIEGNETRSVAYLQSWLSKLEANPKWIVQAAGKAQKAADWILGKMETETLNDKAEA